MTSDSEDDMWYETYPKNTNLLLSPSDQPGVLIPMTTDTKLPHRYKGGKGQYYVVYNDLSASFNGNRLAPEQVVQVQDSDLKADAEGNFTVTVHIPPASIPGRPPNVIGQSPSISSDRSTMPGPCPAMLGPGPSMLGPGPTMLGPAPDMLATGPAVVGLCPTVLPPGPALAYPGLAINAPVLGTNVPSIHVAAPGLGLSAHGAARTVASIAPDQIHNVVGPPTSGPSVMKNVPVIFATKSIAVPPASVDFVSNVWNNFEETVMPLLGGVAQQAVRENKDPVDIGNYDSVKIQTEILECTYSYVRSVLGNSRSITKTESQLLASALRFNYGKMFGKMILPGRKPSKFEGRDTVPSTILHGYYYRYKTRLTKEGILSGAKKIKEDPLETVSKAAKQRQVYCVTKRKFFAIATQDEMNGPLVLFEGQEDKEDTHRIIQCRLRTMDAKLEVAAPMLTDYKNLEDHFEWICEGSVRDTVERKLGKELRLLEQYLLSQGQQDLNNILTSYARECEEHVYESGSTYRWVGILRAAEQHWKTSEEPALFRTELEGINGSSPQLLFSTLDRKVTFTLCLDGAPFMKNIEGLDRAICAFFYVCFCADLEYPQGSAVLATLLQRRVVQLDENGTISASVRDRVNKADRRKKPYENKIREYRDRLLELPDVE